MLVTGKTYRMSGFDVVCVKLKKNGLYKMQTLGMTAGPWPGEEDISDYDDVTETFTQNWAGVISKFRLPNIKQAKIEQIKKALTEAALNYSSFGASVNVAWLNIVKGINYTWYVYSGGNFGGSRNQNYSFVVAPAFDLDPAGIVLDGDEIKRAPEVMLKPGEEYKMSGYRVVCIERGKDGLYKMQTLGMTSGTWPGEGDISVYDDVTKSFTKNWAGITSKFKLPKLTEKIDVRESKTRKALTEAALNYRSFGASYHDAWLGAVNGSNGAWSVDSNGYVYGGDCQDYSYVVAPSFLLDPSKIILVGDEIKRKLEGSTSDIVLNDTRSDVADIIVQFARLWGQHEAYCNSAAEEDLAEDLKQYDSIELLELLTKWAKEYMESDIEDTCEFFGMKISKHDRLFERLKEELFINGPEAIEDFLGYEFDSTEDKDVTENRMNDVYSQMPDEEFQKYLDKYGIQ